METRRHQSGSELFAAVGPMLTAREPEHSLLMGLADSGKPFAGCELALTAWSGREPRAALLQTSINQAIISVADRAAAGALGCALADAGTHAHGIVGPTPAADAAARAFAQAAGCGVEIERRLLLHQLRGAPEGGPVNEIIRPALPGDRALLIEWVEGFDRDTRAPEHTRDAEKRVRQGIEFGRLFVLEADGTPVTSGCWGRPTPHTKTINFVYTLPEHRGRGYGRAVTAQLAGHLLTLGTRDILLFTDADDPIPNRVYARVGFTPTTEFTHWAFKYLST